MTFRELELPGVFLLEPRVFGDERGYFFESFRDDLFREQVADITFRQQNQSRSARGVLRGLHFQLPPHAQAKLVRAVQGEILDVAVDVRRGSPTFGRHVAARLSDQNHHQLFVPHGFAHGFVVLSDWAIVHYMTDRYYAPDSEGAVRYDDPALEIDWVLPESELLLSDKDRSAPLLDDATLFTFDGEGA